MLRRTIPLALLSLLTATGAVAQPASLHFEVASAKPALRRGAYSGDLATGRVSFGGVPLAELITSAYNLQPYQLNGPSWLWSEFAELNATFPPHTTLEQYRQMLANLLVERFGLTFHNMPKSFSGFEIALERGGPSSAMKPSPEKADSKGAVFNGRNNGAGLMHYTITQTSMHLMCNRLMLMLRPMNPLMGLGRPDFSPVEDRTGLSGKFDFELDVVAGPPVSESGETPEQFNDSVNNVADALRNQLGLRLKRTKIELPVLVVDGMLKIPSPN